MSIWLFGWCLTLNYVNVFSLKRVIKRKKESSDNLCDGSHVKTYTWKFKVGGKKTLITDSLSLTAKVPNFVRFSIYLRLFISWSDDVFKLNCFSWNKLFQLGSTEIHHKSQRNIHFIANLFSILQLHCQCETVDKDDRDNCAVCAFFFIL